MDFMRRIAEKVGTVAHDLGSVNQVIDAEIQQHFARTGAPREVRRRRVDDQRVINRALAGGMELNRRLTELSQTYAERKVRDAPRPRPTLAAWSTPPCASTASRC